MFFILGALIHLLIYFISSNKPDTFMEFLGESDLKSMALFFAVFGLVYPLVGYVKQKVEVSKPFDEYKEEILHIFIQLNFVLISDKDGKIIFRHKSIFPRLLRLYEDSIELDYSDSPIVLSGLRRDAYRLARMIEYHVRNTEKEE
jgi:hypothetical protein